MLTVFSSLSLENRSKTKQMTSKKQAHVTSYRTRAPETGFIFLWQTIGYEKGGLKNSDPDLSLFGLRNAAAVILKELSGKVATVPGIRNIFGTPNIGRFRSFLWRRSAYSGNKVEMQPYKTSIAWFFGSFGAAISLITHASSVNTPQSSVRIAGRLFTLRRPTKRLN